jgi:hypothetical protein
MTLIFAIIFFTTIKISNVTAVKFGIDTAYNMYLMSNLELVYDDVHGTVYHPKVNQCDNTPFITGDGSRINPHTANNDRWVAVSQDLLYSEYRANLLRYPERDKRFQGNIRYGDTIWVESPHEEINGWWVVRDAMNKRYENKIDFLQSGRNGSIYGVYTNIRIYRIENFNYSNLKKHLSV